MEGAKHSALVTLIWTGWLGVILEGVWSGGGSSSVTRWENIFWGLCEEIEFSFVWGWGKHLSSLYPLWKKRWRKSQSAEKTNGDVLLLMARGGSTAIHMDTCKYYFPPRGACKGRVSSILLIINNSRVVKCLLKYPVSFSACLCAEQGKIVSMCEKGKWETRKQELGGR